MPHYVSVQHSSSSPARDVGFNLVVFGPLLQHEHRCRLPWSQPCWASVSVFLSAVNNVQGLWYTSRFSAFVIVNLARSLSTKAVHEHARRMGEAQRGSYVYNGSSAAAGNIKQHFPSAYLCTYNIVSLLWPSHSCCDIHLMTNLSLLWLCIVSPLTHSLTHSPTISVFFFFLLCLCLLSLVLFYASPSSL